ncbi:MAK10-like protein [Tanacetum coccineum]
MGDENPIRTLGDYSKPSHEGYRNTIELSEGNNVVLLRSDTIRLVQNRCSFHGLQSEDPNQHLKDFLKLVDSLDLDGENRERTRLCLFQFSLRDQASNWLERFPVGSISTWEDLTTRFLVQFFPPGKTAKLRNDILMLQQHHEESLFEAWTQSWAILEDLALYDNESWNDPRDFTKPVKAIVLPQDVPRTSDRRLIELQNQVQRLMEAYLASTQLTQETLWHTRVAAISHGEKEELRKKGIKSPSKFTDSDTEEDTSSTNAHEHKIDDMVRRSEGIKEQGKEDDEIETDMEVEEVIEEEESEFETDEEIKELLEEDEDNESFNSFLTMEELSHHEWLLKHPRPPWEKAKVRAGSLNNIKISCMNDQGRNRQNSMNEISNFIGRVKHIKVFIGSFAYECEFMILEDTSSIIDRHLREMVFGKPFIDETGLVYDEEKGTVMFEQGDEKITFKIPYTMEIFKKTWLMGLSTNSIPPSVHEENFDHGKTHYYQRLLIEDGYKQDKGDRRGIRHLMRLEKEMIDNKGEVALYLMRRSLEVLRKFHWMILEGRFNQLSHVSSPLLSKPGEY